MQTCSKATQRRTELLDNPSSYAGDSDDDSIMASKLSTLPHLSAPYKSVNFFMRGPTMIKNAVVTLDTAGTKFISWEVRLWDTIDFVTNIPDYLANECPAGKERCNGVI
ncbi:hypothetical protein CROQUDRAFT_95061 [Cronartium quercuum f. sp. fusiforme G11]|uniref:Uncharacterized protein n=1 Tax=Cronartium quercuum f. sp. fusiforme G11 TaxID=708437 RepID=A0A9P6NHV3_9BASI|nr:hypothetical protein CROQUDRAFT_95061 [Cronartium quercuum f. sp. fusiforme G11]